jgi:hypothetical protein
MENKTKKEVEADLDQLAKVIPYLCKTLVMNCNNSYGYNETEQTEQINDYGQWPVSYWQSNYSSWCLATEKELPKHVYELFGKYSIRYCRLLRRQDRYDAFMTPLHHLWENYKKTKPNTTVAGISKDVMRMIHLRIAPKIYMGFVAHDTITNKFNVTLVDSSNEHRCNENSHMWSGIDSVQTHCGISQWLRSYAPIKGNHGPVDHMIGAGEKIIIDVICHMPLEELLAVKIPKDFVGKKKQNVRTIIKKYKLFGYPEYAKKQFKR